MYSIATSAQYLLSPSVNRKSSRSSKPHNAARFKAGRTPSGNRTVINISGWKFYIHESCLNELPDALLGNKEKRNLFYDVTEKEFFFDRDPYLFRNIYKYYKTGKLHFPEGECCEAFIDELAFFGIDPNELSDCCYEPYGVYLDKMKEKEELQQEKENENHIHSKSVRELCWIFCEEPDSTRLAKTFYYITCIIILVSIATNCAETITCEVCVPPEDNLTTQVENKTVCYVDEKCGHTHHQLFFIVDTFCVTYFIMEYFLRLYASPNRWRYLTSKMSIIDILAVLPYFIDLVLEKLKITGSKFVDMFRLFRIVRVFKLLRHSDRLQDLTSALSQSTSELGLIFFLYLMIVIIFASIIYYLEKMGNSKSVFPSIPEAMWYTVVTTTTLG